MQHHPTDFPSALVPYLSVADPDAFATFLQAAFDVTRMSITRDGDGVPAHCEAFLHGAVIEFSLARPQWPATNVGLHLFVDQPETYIERAIAAGATLTYPVTDHPYGERSGGVRDPWGNHWFIATLTDQVARAANG